MGLEAHARVKRGTQVAREEGGSEDTTGQFIIIARAFMTTSNSKSGINGCAPDTKYTVSILAPHICESWGLITGKCAFGHCRKNKKTKMHIGMRQYREFAHPPTALCMHGFGCA